MIELNFMYASFTIPIFENKREIYRYTDDKCFKILRKRQEETKFLKRLLLSQIDAVEHIYYPERVKKDLQGMFSFQKK